MVVDDQMGAATAGMVGIALMKLLVIRVGAPS